MNDDLGLDLLLNKLLCFSNKLSCEHSDSGCAITDLLILSVGDIDQNFCGWVINMNRFQNCGAIIGDSDCSLALVDRIAPRLTGLVNQK